MEMPERLVRYYFRSSWTTRHDPSDVYAALHELGRYPEWWREVRVAEEVAEGVFRLSCRSLLPYWLRFTSTLARADEDAGVLESRLSGDLEGWSRWLIRPHGGGAELVFEEDVVTNKPSLRLLAPVARPAFRVNHTLMIRNARRGLETYMAGYALGRAGARRDGAP